MRGTRSVTFLIAVATMWSGAVAADPNGGAIVGATWGVSSFVGTRAYQSFVDGDGSDPSVHIGGLSGAYSLHMPIAGSSRFLVGGSLLTLGDTRAYELSASSGGGDVTLRSGTVTTGTLGLTGGVIAFLLETGRGPFLRLEAGPSAILMYQRFNEADLFSDSSAERSKPIDQDGFQLGLGAVAQAGYMWRLATNASLFAQLEQQTTWTKVDRVGGLGIGVGVIVHLGR